MLVRSDLLVSVKFLTDFLSAWCVTSEEVEAPGLLRFICFSFHLSGTAASVLELWVGRA